MTPALTFVFGLVLLILFGLYFIVENERTKRGLGTALTVLLCAFCIDSFLPLQKKIHLGLDLQGGTSFLVRLVPPTEENGQPRKLTPEMQQQAVEGLPEAGSQLGAQHMITTKTGPRRTHL